MGTVEDMDQFELLEERIDSLIKYVASLKKEKESLAEKLHIQEEKLTDLTQELEHLKEARGRVKQRIVGILEKIDQAEI